ncbi:MAG: MOSC N-terminal beta barrel domain-containing protein, partial [Ktedonobacteraceae bacterium]|nr:MOSC N-terminal beta barrel domain-containing protein [Ktedonobacteraceae bacterium]
MPDLFLSHIRLYPIKGCGGTDVQVAQIDKRGLCYDRRWLLVNERGLGLQQFDYPRLSLVIVS